MNMSVMNAAEALEGLTLDGGWRVDGRVPRSANATGGNFCVGYFVSHLDGREGFLKALNYARMFNHPDPLEVLRVLTESFALERDLLRHCGDSRMSHVVISIADGIVRVPGYPIETVNYIIFERAAGDVRAELDKDPDADATFKLRCLHNVAVGLRQLHQKKIAHQDLKPSNILIFDSDFGTRASKIGDLGRATAANRPAEHDALAIAGDYTYAPLEQLYGWIPQDFGPRRLACDLYQLGSLIVFMFTGVHLNASINMELLAPYHWANWGNSYHQALPYLRDAFGRVLLNLEQSLPKCIATELARLVAWLCDPDPALRGHPTSRRGTGNPYALDRIITLLDLLAFRAMVAKKVGSK